MIDVTITTPTGQAARPAPLAVAARLSLSLVLCWGPCASGPAQGSDVAELVVTTAAGETIARLELSSEAEWCLVWNHSVTGFEVRDCFAYRNGRLLLVSHHSPDFAAGLGHVQGRGRLETDAQGHYLIEDIDEPIADNRLVLRVGSAAVDHRLLHGGRSLSLSALAAGARVIVSVVAKDGRGSCLEQP